MRTTLYYLVAMLLLSGCAESVVSDDVRAPGEDSSVSPETSGTDLATVEVTPRHYEPVVFAVVSDLHLDGGFEDSISQNVAALFMDAAGRSPAPEFLAITGDLVDTLEEPLVTGDGSNVDALKKLLALLAIPIETVLGNHDYYTDGAFIFEMTGDPTGRTSFFQDEVGVEPWYFTEHGGMRFVYLNSMYGERVADSFGLNGSMGVEQLKWLDELLAEEIPTVLFLHHPPATVLEDGEESLETVVREHADAVLAIFVGHIHVWGRSEFEGVPVYITEAGYDGVGLHHVRVDGEAGTVEILNEDELDYGETVEVPCVPEDEPQLTNLESLAGSLLVLQVPDAHISPMGLGSYLRNLVSDIPLVIKLGESAPDGKSVAALVTTGSNKGDGADGAPAYIQPVLDGPCLATTLALDGACFVTSPVTLAIDLGKVLGFPLPMGWRVRAEFRDLVFSGVLTDAGAVEMGVLRTTLDFNLGAHDVEGIIIQEYCAGKLDNCEPGTAGRPVCPEEPGLDFFQEIPANCDVTIVGIGLRTLFSMFESVEGYAVELDANFETFAAHESATPEPGGLAAELFAPLPEGNCPTE
jgi:hypothetical protein